jgi:hypothetical protein
MNSYVGNLELELKPYGNSQVGEELSVQDAVVSIATSYAEKVSHFLVSVKTNAVLVTFDATSPAEAGAGVYLPTNHLATWSRAKMLAAKFIRAANAANATVRVEPMSL